MPPNADDLGSVETTGENMLEGVRQLVRRLAAQSIHNGHGPSAKDHDRKLCMKCLDVINALAFLDGTAQADESPEAQAPQDVTLAQ